jgi:hypothetical protein
MLYDRESGGRKATTLDSEAFKVQRSDERKQGESDEDWKARLEFNRVQREWQTRHPGYGTAGRRARHLKRKYGATPEEIEELLERQGRACAICGAPQPNRRYLHGGFLGFDHNHQTGQHRGMLCKKCNQVVAILEDDQWLLEQAALYLESYRD